MKTQNKILLLGACLVAAALPAAGGELADMALGSAGELLRVQAGAYGDLFDDPDLAADTPVLALEKDLGDGHPTRLLIPGTEDARIESDPIILHESIPGAAILLWRSQGTDGAFHIDFAVFRDSEAAPQWSEVRTVESGETPVAFSAAPLLAVTRNALHLELDKGRAIDSQRTIVHVVWRADSSAHYTALVFLAGVYLGWNEVQDLGGLLVQSPSESGEAGVEDTSGLTSGLEHALSLERGADDHTVLAAVANAGSGRVGAIEIKARPLAISVFGDLVRERILAAADLFDPDDLSPFFDIIMGELVPLGHRLEFHPAVVDYVLTQVRAWIEAGGPSYGANDLKSLPDDARELTIYLAGLISATEVFDPATSDGILDIDLGGFLDQLSASPLERMLDIRVRSNRPAPAIGDGVTAIFTSRDGRDLLIGWKPADQSRVHYVESRRQRDGGRWSEPGSLKMGELAVEEVVQLLQQKIR